MKMDAHIDDANQAKIPERALWSSVLSLAVRDAFAGRGTQADEARNFLLCGGRWFEQICDMAGVDPNWVRGNVYKAINNPLKARRIYEIGKRLDRRK